MEYLKVFLIHLSYERDKLRQYFLGKFISNQLIKMQNGIGNNAMVDDNNILGDNILGDNNNIHHVRDDKPCKNELPIIPKTIYVMPCDNFEHNKIRMPTELNAKSRRALRRIKRIAAKNKKNVTQRKKESSIVKNYKKSIVKKKRGLYCNNKKFKITHYNDEYMEKLFVADILCNLE